MNRELGLKAALHSGLYPTYVGIEGPTQDIPPSNNTAFEYSLLLWPASLCKLIALETNRYAHQRRICNWQNVSVGEVWTFLAIIVLMGIHRLPRIRNYWSKDPFLGIPTLQ